MKAINDDGHLMAVLAELNIRLVVLSYHGGCCGGGWDQIQVLDTSNRTDGYNDIPREAGPMKDCLTYITDKFDGIHDSFDGEPYIDGEMYFDVERKMIYRSENVSRTVTDVEVHGDGDSSIESWDGKLQTIENKEQGKPPVPVENSNGEDEEE